MQCEHHLQKSLIFHLLTKVFQQKSKEGEIH